MYIEISLVILGILFFYNKTSKAKHIKQTLKHNETVDSFIWDYNRYDFLDRSTPASYASH